MSGKPRQRQLWRLWTVTEDGRLTAPFASLAARRLAAYAKPWPVRGAVRAVCDVHDEPPVDDHECGLRGMGRAANILTVAVMAEWLDIDTWKVPRALSGRVVLAVGGVRLSGRIAGPSPNDPLAPSRTTPWPPTEVGVLRPR